jgi:hypothetical protein
MKTFVAVVVFGLIILAIIVMVVINFSYKGIKKIKQEAEEKYYRNQRIKEQKEKNPFGEDYFKSATPTKKSQPKKSQPKKEKPRKEEPKKEQPKKEQPQPQAEPDNTILREADGSTVTIINEREPEDKRKIFDNSDGEYVEFEEV